ncbi:MAG: tetratricopeptide repeat protein [Blastocatellia bacterium]
MKRWITILLVYLALGALLLVVARFMLPVMGLGGVEGEFVQPLIKLAPTSFTIFLVSVALIVFDLKRQAKLAAKQAKRLVEEAEGWSDDFVIGEEIKSLRPVAQVSPEQAPAFQPEAESSRNGFSSEPQIEQSFDHALDRKIESGSGAEWKEEWKDELAVAAVSNPVAEDSAIARRRVTSEIAGGFSEDHIDYQSEAKSEDKNNSAADEDVFARYEHLIESSVSAAPALHQLPPPLPEFAGRSFELAELYAARSNPGIRSLNVQGPGGVGKTTLALKLADQLAPHYPDAQFYIDLKGASAQPLSVAEAQSHVIRAYLPTVRLPENEAELNELYHSVLLDKRALLLLDNAVNAQQVAQLIAPEGCLTIVTSRNHIALAATFTQQLEGLTLVEARDLLQRIVPHIGDHAEKIAELCWYLPLALRLAASALTLNPELKVEDYVSRLEEMRREERSVRAVDAVLSLSYDLLVPGLQTLWRRLAVFRDTFEAGAAAALWKINPAVAANALDRLMSYSLIERNRATGRFRLHDLMAQFADAHSTDEERAVARQLHSAHYQSVLHEADALYEQGGVFLKQGLDLVDLEWNNIQAGQVWAATHVDDNRAACELCNSYPDAGKYVLDLRHHPRERIRWSEAALLAARQLKRRKAAVRHLVALGDSYADLAEVHHAIECYEQALQLAREAHDRRGEADALSGLGTAHYLGGGLGRARELHKEAMTIFATVGDRRGEVNSLGHLGLAHFAMGELRNAVTMFDQQLKAAREIGDRRSESNALGGLGLSHYVLGDARRAAELFNRQLEITREIGDRRGEASALGNLGNAYVALKFRQQAIAFHEQALAVAREIGDRRNEAEALGGLGIAEYLSGNIERSIELLERQLKLAGEIGDRRGEANALGNLGEAHIVAGDHHRAIDLLTRGFNLARQIGDIQGQANALFNLSLALDRGGDRAQAIAQAETALELFKIAEHPNAEVVRRQLSLWSGRGE